MKLLRLGIFISLWSFCYLTFADVLVLKNGDVLKGKVVSQKENFVVFYHKGKNIKVRAEDISFIEFLSDKVVEVSLDGKVIKGVEVGVKNGKVIVKTSLGQKEVDLSAVKEVKEESSDVGNTNFTSVTNVIFLTNYIVLTNALTNLDSNSKVGNDITSNNITSNDITDNVLSKDVIPSIYVSGGISSFDGYISYTFGLWISFICGDIVNFVQFYRFDEFSNFRIGLGYVVLKDFLVRDSSLGFTGVTGIIFDNVSTIYEFGVGGELDLRLVFLKLGLSFNLGMDTNKRFLFRTSLGLGF
jgi:hypothetical protein